MSPLLPLSLPAPPRRDDLRPLVIYHGGGCPDGFGAALAAWLFYRDRAEYLGLDHGEARSIADLPPLEGRAVYILDFAFPPDIMREIDARAARLVLLDHHLSAQRQLAGLACRCGTLHFDMGKCGARLAWEFFQRGRPLPDLLRYIEDRDLWTWHDPESAAFLAALDMESQSFERWAEIAAQGPAQRAAFIARGEAMDQQFRRLAADIAAGAEPLVFNGQRGLMVNAPGAFHSLVGDMLSRQGGSFALVWSAGQGGLVKAGLRSQRGYDCLPLAESMGGGGHAQACGFRMGADRLPELLSGRLDAQKQ